MLAPPKYSFRDVERSAVLEERVRELVQRLQRCHERIDHCHLTVARRRALYGGVATPGATAPGDSQPFEVQIDLSVPGAEIHAHSASGRISDPADVFIALNAAFDDARRQLQELQRERTGISRSA